MLVGVGLDDGEGDEEDDEEGGGGGGVVVEVEEGVLEGCEQVSQLTQRSLVRRSVSSTTVTMNLGAKEMVSPTSVELGAV